MRRRGAPPSSQVRGQSDAERGSPEVLLPPHAAPEAPRKVHVQRRPVRAVANIGVVKVFSEVRTGHATARSELSAARPVRPGAKTFQLERLQPWAMPRLNARFFDAASTVENDGGPTPCRDVSMPRLSHLALGHLPGAHHGPLRCRRRRLHPCDFVFFFFFFFFYDSTCSRIVVEGRPRPPLVPRASVLAPVNTRCIYCGVSLYLSFRK